MSIAFLLFLLALLTSVQSQVAESATVVEPQAAAPVVEAPKVCDEACFATCSQDKDIILCGTECNCQDKAQQLQTELTKNERCWGQCRQQCVIDMFTKPKVSDLGTPGDCFGDCSCVCNRGCTQSCEDSPFKENCLQSCGCPKDKKQTEGLIKRSQDYFDAPLDPRSSDEIAAEFQGKLADVIAETFNKKEAKEKKVLNKKLQKIEDKWNRYVENANKLGIDTQVFCNQT